MEGGVETRTLSEQELTRIRETVPAGNEHAKSMRDTAAALGITERQAREMIAAARIAGELIASNVHGYFYTTDPDELTRFYRSARRRAMTCLTTVRATRAALKAAGVDVLELEGRRKGA